MAVTYYFDEACMVLVTELRDLVTDDELFASIEASWFHPDRSRYDLLVDCRLIKFNAVTTQGLRLVVQLMEECNTEHVASNFAVVVTDPIIKARVGVFRVYSQPSMMNVAIFSSAREAFSWLRPETVLPESLRALDAAASSYPSNTGLMSA